MDQTVTASEFVASEDDMNKVRLVDINSEILKGGAVKPGILFDECIDLTLTEDEVEPGNNNLVTQVNAITTDIELNSNSCISVVKGMKFVVPSNFTHITPNNKVNYVKENCTLPITSNVIVSNESKIVSAVNSATPTVETNLNVGDTASVNKPVIPNNNTIVLPPTSVGKNTIIGLPNNVFLVPIQYFNTGSSFRIPKDNKFQFVTSLNPENVSVPTQLISQTEQEIILDQQKSTPMITVRKSSELLKPEVIAEALKPPELKHPCWKAKKNRKLDLEGFSYHDILGFYKAEYTRSKRCLNFVDSLARRAKRDIDRLLEELNPRIKEDFYAKHYGLKTVRIVLDRNEVTNYLKAQKQRLSKKVKRRRRRRQQIGLSFRCETEASLKKIDFTKPIYVVNHYNFGSLDYDNLTETVVFINSNNVITEMCLDSFPSFRTAVYRRYVKIVDESTLEFFLKCYSIEAEAFQGLPQRVKQCTRGESYERMKRLCVAQHNVQLHVALDHSYSLTLTEQQCVDEPLLKIQKIIPCRL